MEPDLSVVGIDSAKRIFHLVGMDERGKIILRKRLVRGEVISFAQFIGLCSSVKPQS